MTFLTLLRDAVDGRPDAVRVVATAIVLFSFASTAALCAFDAISHRGHGR